MMCYSGHDLPRLPRFSLQLSYYHFLENARLTNDIRKSTKVFNILAHQKKKRKPRYLSKSLPLLKILDTIPFLLPLKTETGKRKILRNLLRETRSCPAGRKSKKSRAQGVARF